MAKMSKKERMLLRQKKLLAKSRFSRLRHTFISLFTFLSFVLGFIALCMYTLFNGPSQSFSDSLTRSVTETSALKFLPYLFMPAAEVEESFDRTDMEKLSGFTNTDLYDFSSGFKGSLSAQTGGDRTDIGVITKSTESEPTEIVSNDPQAPVYEDIYGVGEGIRIEEVKGATYKGYIAIIDDPSRVSVGVSSNFKGDKPGKKIEEIASDYGAVLAVNGGAFEDVGGGGDGGKPLGLVVSEGERLNRANKQFAAAGFDKNHRLIVGDITNNDAEALGIRDAVAFGPALIINGTAAGAKSTNMSLNPRTAIGQRADGAVLLLVIDGRKVNTLGASFADLIAIMQEYGAINACNLDGGSSSVMIAAGKQINEGIEMTGSRKLPTAIIVR